MKIIFEILAGTLNVRSTIQGNPGFTSKIKEDDPILGLQFFGDFECTPVELDNMRPCIHDIFPGTIYSTGISAPSFIKHMKCVDSVFKFTTRQYLEPFLGPQKGMQMLTVITIFFFLDDCSVNQYFL